MKFFSAIFFLVLLLACKKTTEVADAATATSLRQSTWRVTRFINSSNNQTATFTGYNFNFNYHPVIDSVYIINRVRGTWRAQKDDISSKLFLNFRADTLNFNLLNGTWRILSQTPATISLQLIDSDNIGQDSLTLQKN